MTVSGGFRKTTHTSSNLVTGSRKRGTMKRKYRDEVYENMDWWFALETYAKDYQRYYLAD